MEIFMANGSDQGTMHSLSQCSGALGAMFLSDITMADGRYLEQYALSPRKSGIRSKYKHPREWPTARDWREWQNFWHSHTGVGGRLHVQLGRWLHPTHRQWEWYFDKENDALQRVTEKRTSYATISGQCIREAHNLDRHTKCGRRRKQKTTQLKSHQHQ